ncbi:MAG: class I SAM-dependent methyltransferase [Deltaproteobacteria bacterium]|nr:class I SAM-dependent methyltransferase [Deltaproteobacteria bacterium]
MQRNAQWEKRREQIEQNFQLLHKILNRPISRFEKTVVDFCFALYFQLIGNRIKIKVDHNAARMARDIFCKYFPDTVEEMLRELLRDPEGYIQKVEEYESVCPPPMIDFGTETKTFKLIMNDPARQMEETRTELALLSSIISCNGNAYYALDIGTGNGRLARVMENSIRCISGNQKGYRVFGVDLSEKNIEDANTLNKKTGASIVFTKGDMNRLLFPSDVFALVNSASASYLNPKHRRPFDIAEMARVLSPDYGRATVTNPTENFSLKEYSYMMMRSNRKTYLNPMNIVQVMFLGQCGAQIEDLMKARPEMQVTTTNDMMNMLKRTLRAEIVDVGNWPLEGGPPLFWGFTFSVNGKTKESLGRYIDVREKQRKHEDWIPLDRVKAVTVKEYPHTPALRMVS